MTEQNKVEQELRGQIASRVAQSWRQGLCFKSGTVAPKVSKLPQKSGGA